MTDEQTDGACVVWAESELARALLNWVEKVATSLGKVD